MRIRLKDYTISQVQDYKNDAKATELTDFVGFIYLRLYIGEQQANK